MSVDLTQANHHYCKGITSNKILVVAMILLCLPSISLSNNGGREAITLSPSTFTDKPVLLKTGWKWHSGDDPAWSAPGFDDSGWAPANTQLPGLSLHKMGWEGIGWFRLHVDVEPALWQRALTLECFSFGAIEVYLDGELVYSSGVVGTLSETERVDFSPMRERSIVRIALPNKPSFTLAARYSNFNELGYLKLRRAVRSTGFWLYMSTGSVETRMRHQAADGRKAIGSTHLLMGMLSASMVLHLLLYLFQRQQKANLYYALYVGSAAVGIYFLNVQVVFASSLRAFHWYMGFSQVLIMLTGLLGCCCLYSLFYTCLPRTFGYLVIGYLLCLVATWRISYAIFLLYVIACFGEMLRVMIVVCLKREEDAWLFAVGSFILLVAGASHVLSGTLILATHNDFPQLKPSIFLAGFFCFFTSMSIYLARQYARASAQQVRLEAENEKKANELQTAREVQQFFLQRNAPTIDGFEIALTCEVANETGGDFASYFRVGEDETQLGIVLMDVSGHGLRAAMMAALANGLLQSEIQHTHQPLAILRRMDEALEENLPADAFVAMSLAMIDVDEKRVSYYSAGFPRPILLRHGEQVELGIVGALPLGTALPTEYTEHSIALVPGDTLLLFSDGLLEARGPDSKTYDASRLKTLLPVLAAQELPAQAWLDQLLADVRMYTYPTVLQDDVSIAVVKVL